MDEHVVREAVFAWLRARMLTQPVFTRDDLGSAEVLGQRTRIVGTQTGIWKPRGFSSALSILTGYYANPMARPYQDEIGPDQMLRYKWRGTDPQHSDNRALREAMRRQDALVWFVGVGYLPGSHTQVFQPILPVWLVAEELADHQFVVALDPSQRALIEDGRVHATEIERRYNEVIVRQRLHQPLFRAQVLQAYERRCTVCRLPFVELLDAAHIKTDSTGGRAAVSNGLALCKIHHGAFDSDILGISPDYRISIKSSVLHTIDGPTLQHALKEMHGLTLGQLPRRVTDRPDRELLAERFDTFLEAS